LTDVPLANWTYVSAVMAGIAVMTSIDIISVGELFADDVKGLSSGPFNSALIVK
jgi:hypothetical protein